MGLKRKVPDLSHRNFKIALSRYGYVLLYKNVWRMAGTNRLVNVMKCGDTRRKRLATMVKMLDGKEAKS